MRGALAAVLLLATGALAACSPRSQDPAVRRGKADFARAQCGACHQLEGVAGAIGAVGPPLDGLGRRSILAGVLPNTPANLAQWIRQPQRFKPGDAMPNAQFSPGEAQDLAAFLETR